MTCNLCGTNEATVHLTEIVNHQMIEIHLCETCAQEKGTSFKTHFNFGDLFAGLNEFVGTQKGQVDKAAECPHCKMSYEQFGKCGRLGCPRCYESFAPLLLPLIKRVQRTTEHVGKKPAKGKTSKSRTKSAVDLQTLQDRLRQSIQEEAFEDAAQIRDQIRKIQEKQKKSRKSSS